MRIFSFYENGENAVSLVPDDDLDYFDDHFVGKRMTAGWSPPPFKVLRKTKPLRDFVSWFGAALVVTGKAKTALEPLIGEHVEFLPLVTLKGKELFAVNVLEIVDCLELKASGITRAQDDPTRIIHIEKFVFDRTRLRNVPVFKIPERSSAIFVSEEFARIVVEEKLSGAGFDDPENIRYVKVPWDGTATGLPSVREFEL